jgi:CRISPR/Cas system-associated exonuclease Cas4 (RecB family)
MVENFIKSIANQKKKTLVDYKKFLSDVDAAYAETRPSEKFQVKKTFSPSTLGYNHGTCARFWWLAFTGGVWKEEVSGKAIANMENGTYAHSRLEKFISKTEFFKESEREILSIDPPIRGFADLILEQDGAEVVGEIKTIKEQYYLDKEMTRTPNDSHLLQILIYMKVLKAKEGFLMYENKNTQDLMVIPVHMSKQMKDYMAYVWEWLRETNKAFQLGTIPKNVFRKNAKICGKCPLKDMCREAAEGTIEIKPLEVSIEKML